MKKLALKHSRIWRSLTLGLLLIVGAIGTAQADSTYRVGWVWNSDPTATSIYKPNANYSYDSAGGNVQIVPISTGYYKVLFGKLYNGVGVSDVQVTAYETSGYCVSDGWVWTGTTVEAWVKCFDAAGTLANTAFDLLYQDRSGVFGSSSKGLAFVWANEPSSASYTPDLGYQYNSTGATNTITRSATGTYAVDLPGLDPEHSNVQVTAYASSAARCKLASWYSDGATGTTVYVLCFDGSGNPADKEFNLAYAVQDPYGLTTASGSRGAWVWAGNATNSSYTPNVTWNYNGFGGGHNTVTHSGTGDYTMTVPGSSGYSTSNVFVTAYGPDSDYCNSDGWYPVHVQCYSQGGSAANSKYDASFQTGN